jgi:ribosomal protein S18 acetylase RimI-like enzyme
VGVEVRSAVADDRDAVVALWRACGLTRPWNDPVADFELATRGLESTVLGLFDAGVPVATAMVGFDGHRGWVYYLCVTPHRQRQGLGRRMMAAAEAWLAARGAPKIQFMVRRDNAAALGFYAALGYTEQGVTTLGRRLDGPAAAA